MLSASNRLRSRADFDSLWKRGRSMYGTTLGIRYAPNQEKQTRFGVVVGVKISRRATKRNLVKRRIREALRREFASQVFAYDVVVIARPGILNRSYGEIQQELGELLKRARLVV